MCPGNSAYLLQTTKTTRTLNKLTSIRKILILVMAIMTGISIPSTAQKRGQARIDSLVTELGMAKEDTHRVFLMSQISFSYSYINPDEGLKYGSDAIALAKILNWEKGISYAQYFRGANYLGKSMFPEALNDYLGALAYFEKAGDNKKLSGALSNIGGIYGYQKKDEKALEYFHKALDINNEIFPNSNFVVANLGNIGLIYFNEKNYPKALEYILQARDICIAHKHDDMLPNVLVTLAGIYSGMEDNANAIAYSKEAILASAKAEQAGTLANAQLYLGTAIKQIVTQKNDRLLDSLYQGNTSAALREAKENLQQAISTLQEMGDQYILSTAYQALAQLEEYQGDYKAALLNQKIFKDLQDSVFNADKNEQIVQSGMQYEFDKKEAATRAEQEKKDIRSKNVRNGILIALTGALVFLTVVYRQRNKIKMGKKLSDELLLNILPAEVAEELKTKGKAEANHFDEVTVMFTDFKGFTQISERVSPAELVAEIDFCFKAFDEIITRNNLEKIKTIGDSYMCAGGLPVANDTHGTDVVNAGLEIQQFMHQHYLNRQQEGKDAFEIRIGINSGPVVAGIVGLKKFAYDIWGDTVNIASRMESACETGKVNISGSTYALVKDKFQCTHRGKIAVKYKGEIDMYFVDGRSQR